MEENEEKRMRNDGGRRGENDLRTWGSGRKGRLEEGVQ